MTSRKIPESAVENLVSDLEGKANVSLSNLNAAGQAKFDAKANTDLSNLSTAGQAILNGKANTDASNFTATGKQTVVGWGMPDYTTTIWSLDATLPYDSFVYCRNNASAGGPDAIFTIYDLSGNIIFVSRLVWSESAQFYIKKGYRYTITKGTNPEAYYYKLGV